MSKELKNIFDQIKRTSIPIDYNHQYDVIMAKVNGEKTAPVKKSIFNIKYASLAAMVTIICVLSLTNLSSIYETRDNSMNEFLTSAFYLEEINEVDDESDLDLLFDNGTFI